MHATPRRFLFTTTALVAVALGLSACAPELGPRSLMSTADQYAVAQSIGDATVPAAIESQAWWRDYDEAQLAALIEEALAGSPDLAVAAARLRAAEAVLESAGAALKPSLSSRSSVYAVREDFDLDNVPDPIASALPNDWVSRGSIGLQLDYQLDFFGRNRAAVAAATSDTKAAEMEMAAARLQISTAVALGYAEVVRLADDRATAAEIVSLREASARLVVQKMERGLENEGQAAQANSEVANAKAQLAIVDGELMRVRHALAALLGKGPDRGLDIMLPLSRLPAAHVVPSSATLDLIGRRPDVMAARLRAEAAAKRVDVARADFYPNVSLSALGGFQTLGLDSLGGGTLAFGQVGPALSLPIFSGGRLEGAYRLAGAEYDGAVAAYNRTLTMAIRDVADAVSSRRALESQYAQSSRALAEVETSHRLIRLRYERGLATYLDVLTVENALVAQRRTLANLQTRAFAIDVALVRALGGGFVHG
jgi:NodT family efflux transporter outer membrane factor (OMF) lipoprotein